MMDDPTKRTWMMYCLPFLVGITIPVVVVSDTLLLEVSGYTWGSIVVAGILCLALALSVKAKWLRIVLVLLFVNIAVLFVARGMWSSGTFNEGIICGGGLWLWVLIAVATMTISVVRMRKARKRTR
jgi:hypothetical protein